MLNPVLKLDPETPAFRYTLAVTALVGYAICDDRTILVMSGAAHKIAL